MTIWLLPSPIYGIFRVTPNKIFIMAHSDDHLYVTYVPLTGNQVEAVIQPNSISAFLGSFFPTQYGAVA